MDVRKELARLTPNELDEILRKLGLVKHSQRSESKKLRMFSKEPELHELVTYRCPGRIEKLKVDILKGRIILVSGDNAKSQRTAWRPLHDLVQLAEYFQLRHTPDGNETFEVFLEKRNAKVSEQSQQNGDQNT